MAKILITGTSKGIGKALSEKLLTENHEIISISRQKPDFQQDNYQHYNIDLNKPDQLTNTIKDISKTNKDIDYIILNAGFGIFKEIDQFSVKEIQNIINVNLTSNLIITNQLVKNLRKRKNAKIIIIGSESGLTGQKKGSIYCASKFALRGFAQSLQKELNNSDIQVNLINPGAINSDFFTNLNFKPAEDFACKIEVEQIVDLISYVLKQRNNFYFEEINLKQLKKQFCKK